MKNYIFYLLIFPLFLNAQINVFINDIENANSGDGIISPIGTRKWRQIFSRRYR